MLKAQTINPSLTNKLLITGIILTTFLSLFFASPVKASPGNECSGDIEIPSETCTSTTIGLDVRLYVSEFQTCQNGNIINKAGLENRKDKMITAFYSVNAESGQDSLQYTPDEKDVKIQFAKNRSVVPEKGDQLTFQMMEAAEFMAGTDRFKMKMTSVTEPDFEDAPVDQYHYVGTFEKTDLNGKVTTGGLNCSVNR